MKKLWLTALFLVGGGGGLIDSKFLPGDGYRPVGKILGQTRKKDESDKRHFGPDSYYQGHEPVLIPAVDEAQWQAVLKLLLPDARESFKKEVNLKEELPIAVFGGKAVGRQMWVEILAIHILKQDGHPLGERLVVEAVIYGEHPYVPVKEIGPWSPWALVTLRRDRVKKLKDFSLRPENFSLLLKTEEYLPLAPAKTNFPERP